MPRSEKYWRIFSPPRASRGSNRMCFILPTTFSSHPGWVPGSRFLQTIHTDEERAAELTPRIRLGTTRNSGIDTKTNLPNAAERLFSDKGIEAVSHREIALTAAVNLSA